jgi:GNAT superfamily N-acetyltransferase
MRIVRYHENVLDACAEFWWSIYKDMPYVHRPDGWVTINTPPIGPEFFCKYLKEGLSGASYWHGDVTEDSIILVEDAGKIEGILVCSIEKEKLTGDILSCYVRFAHRRLRLTVQRNHRGREIAEHLLSEALEHFRKLELHKAVVKGALEVECPIHLAMLDAGFAWEENWAQPPDESGKAPIYDWPTYQVFLGGSLEGFCLQSEIKEKIEKLRKEGIVIERLTIDEFRERRRLDNNQTPNVEPNTPELFAALVDGRLVGWLFEMGVNTDEGRVLGLTTPEVIPSYRRRGIGKVLYHLGIEEVVRQGAQYGYTVTGIHNPARLIYRSVGFKYWYTTCWQMSKRL